MLINYYGKKRVKNVFENDATQEKWKLFKITSDEEVDGP